MRIYIKKLNSNYELIETSENTLGKGGQARVYPIVTPQYANYCLKEYINQNDAKNTFDRISYMIQNPPRNILSSSSFRICWPVAFAYNMNYEFIGYIMPLAFDNSRDLTILNKVKPSPQSNRYKKYKDWYDKFDLYTNQGLINRIKLLCNWAIAIYSLHETKKYVLVDLKPENVLATSTGKISIVDTDSFQISEHGRILFEGPVATPEYFPAEGQQLKDRNIPFPANCDYFSAAVCFYNILTGVHPYSGFINKPPYDNLESIADHIKANLSPYSDKARYIEFCKDLNLHKHFDNLTPKIQSLFRRAFGNDPGKRPSMEEWGKAMHEAVVSNQVYIKTTVKPKNTDSTSIKILNVELGDQDNDCNVIRDFGSKLYNDISYLCFKITYDVLIGGKDHIISYKICKPSGVVMGKAGSKFTNTCNIGNRTGYGLTQVLPGWGNNEKTAYKETGVWMVEFYEGDKCIFKKNFNIFELPAKSVKPKNTNSTSIKILNVEVGDQDYNCNMIRDFGSKLYNDVSYLCFKITYDVLIGGQDHVISYKIHTPSGGVMGKAGSKFTNTCNIGNHTGYGLTQVLQGWGNNEKTAYKEAGVWMVEFYEGDKCIFKKNFTINPTSKYKRPTPPTPPPPPPTKKSHFGLWATLIIAAAFCLYQFWYKDYRDDKNAARNYVVSRYTPMYSSNEGDLKNNFIDNIQYGTELKTYNQTGKWAYVSYNGAKGYVSAKDIANKNVFYSLDNIWGDDDTKNVIDKSRYRYAIVDYLRISHLSSAGKIWQLAEHSDNKATVVFPELKDGYDDYSEFGFVLRNDKANTRTFVLYSFDSNETPIYRHSEDVPKGKYIKSVTYNKWNKKYDVNYTSGGYSYATKRNKTSDTKKETSPSVAKTDLKITAIEFANTDYNNNILINYGRPLYQQDMRYLKGKFWFERSKTTDETVKLQIKIFSPSNVLLRGNGSPSGCTTESEVSLSGKTGSRTIISWGTNNGNYYNAGTYRYEIWYKGSKLYQSNVEIKAANNMSNTSNKSLEITRIEFANQDYDGNTIIDYGKQLYSNTQYLCPKIHYKKNTSGKEEFKLLVKLRKPNGELIKGSDSPEGFSFERKVTLNNYSGTCNLLGYGNKSGTIYKAGTYNCVVWLDNKLLHSTYITIIDK